MIHVPTKWLECLVKCMVTKATGKYQLDTVNVFYMYQPM